MEVAMHRPFSVCLSFDFDAMSLWLATFKKTGPQSISRGEYGARVGLPRILALLAKFDAKATFFTPVHTIRTYPDQVRSIVADGHEIASHGDFHEIFEELDEDEERRVIETSVSVIGDIAGAPPVGFRAPAGDLSQRTLPLLVEYGFKYDSSLMGDDFTPYRCRIGDTWTPDGPYVFGNESRLVELPISFLMDDFPYFEFNFFPYLVGQADPKAVGSIWESELDYMVDNLDEGVFVVAMHPQCIGRGSRMAMLERFMEHARARGAAFERMIDVTERRVATA